jgi:hypothetical protein
MRTGGTERRRVSGPLSAYGEETRFSEMTIKNEHVCIICPRNSDYDTPSHFTLCRPLAART